MHKTSASNQKQIESPFSQSLILAKLKKQQKANRKLKIAFLDIDSTMTGNQKITDQTRTHLENLGYSVVFVTTRTEELVMSGKAYEKSVRQYGFQRPRPHLGFAKGKRCYLDPSLLSPAGLLDPDIIAGSTGTQILIRQKNGGFCPLLSYEKSFGQKPQEWRKGVLSALSDLGILQKASLSPLDLPANYRLGVTDVFMPKYRIILTCENLKQKREVINQLTNAILDQNISQSVKKQLANLQVIDDSHPKKGKYALYLTPKNASKLKAVEWILSALCHSLKAERREFDLLIAGDSFPDLEMGLFGGRGAKTTFLLVGGSRMTDAVFAKQTEPEFTGDVLEKARCELQAETTGFYKFNLNLAFERQIIIADQAYRGKVGVESLFYFLESHNRIMADPTIMN